MRLTPYFSLLGALALRIVAQSAVASNTTTYKAADFNGDYVVLIQGNIVYQIYPLTQEAYDRLPHGDKDDTGVNATLVEDTPPAAPSFHNSIAYISCDARDYGGDIDMQTVIGNAIGANVTGILFYSTIARYCNLGDYPTAYHGYSYLYTTNGTKDSTMLRGNMTGGSYVTTMVNLYSGTAFYNYMQEEQSSWGLGGSGSTAVAMIILYSITGVITALFLIIIITGAVRAHRHPERYGPRNVLGRARQSRAKGIARAMLDTIPIVKFGENREDAVKDVEQPATASTELANRNADGTPTATQPENDITTEKIPRSSDSPYQSDSVGGAIASASTTPPSPTAATAPTEEETQGCSICTDDFERGQDIRVLPCGHQFHPACVDPWLLDVSGTCPLCRVDLNPHASTSGGEGNELPPPLDPEAAAADEAGIVGSGTNRKRDTIRHFFARGWGETASIVTANQAERMAALRRWREENRANAHAEASSAETGAAAAVSEEDSRRTNRLGKLSRLMRRK